MDRQFSARNAKYTPDLRAFALTLHFYSVTAYSFVREQFKNLLPHPDTIRQWYLIVDGTPGFTAESFEAIKMKSHQSERKIVVNITVDEISIRERIDYQNGKYYGYVDLGTGLKNDSHSNEKARNALVFMAVALNSDWKIPLGYFFVNGLVAMKGQVYSKHV